MVGTVFGLVCLSAGLVLLTSACWLVFGDWGLFVAAGVWAGCGVVMIRPEVLYARAT